MKTILDIFIDDGIVYSNDSEGLEQFMIHLEKNFKIVRGKVNYGIMSTLVKTIAYIKHPTEANEATKETIWLRRLITSIGIPHIKYTDIYCDN